VASVALPLVSAADGKPLSTNANWAAVKGLASIQPKRPWNMQSIAQPSFPAAAKVIEEICQAYVSWRYGAQPPKLNQLRRRWQDLKRARSRSREAGNGVRRK